MVTQHGDPPPIPSGPDDNDLVYRRRIAPPHLTLESNNGNTSNSNDRSRQSPNSALSLTFPTSPTKYTPYSPRLARPNLHQSSSYNTSIHSQNHRPRDDDLHATISQTPDQMSSNQASPTTRSSPAQNYSLPHNRFEDLQELSWPLPASGIAPSGGVSRMRSAETNLRISVSMSSLNVRRRSPLSDRQQIDTSSRPVPRFPPRTTPDFSKQYNDPLRSSQTSGQTSYSSFEQMSGTERSSILTKSSSITDMSPDTPGGYFGEVDEMTVEDAIGMYLDDIVDLPEDSTPGFSVSPGGELDAIAEVMYPPNKRASAISLTPQTEDPPTDTNIQAPVLENDRNSYDLSGDADTHELSENHEIGVPGQSQEKAEDHTDVDPSRTTGSSQTEVDPAGPESDLRTIAVSPEATATRKPSPNNLSIDVSATKRLDSVAAADQPIPTPRYSTVLRVSGKVPPSFLPGTDDRDRYGFRKANHHVSRGQFEDWNKPYAAIAEQRRLKWAKLLQSSGLPTESPITFPAKSNAIKRYVRKGIPSEYRGAAWFYYAGGYQHMHPHPGHYAKLVHQAMSSPINTDKEHIERDLYRTFPDNVHFKPDTVPELMHNARGEGVTEQNSVVVETQMIRSLRRVLYAFALHNPRIGYTQSLNFITGLLLLFLPEEKAFWMLHIITSELFPGTHEISLEGANVDMWILMVLLRDNLPAVYTKIVTTTVTTSKSKAPALTVNMRLPDITLGLTNWLMSMFIGSLPLETTLRVWDCFFYEGSKTFFRVALGIFKAGEREILSVSDPMEVFQIVQAIPKKLLDANSLLDESLSRKYRMGQARIDTLREQRREAVRQEKTRLSLFTSKGLGMERPATRTGARSPLPRLDGWRAMKKHTFN